MRIKHAAILLSLLVCCAFATRAGSPSAAGAQAAAPSGDIREVFLSVPYPANVESGAAAGDYTLQDGDAFARHFKTADARRELLARTEFGKHENVLDTQGGYVLAGFDEDGGGTPEGDPQYFILVTYFNMADGSRLVVLEFGDRNTPDDYPYRNDYFFTLSGGHYTQQPSAKFLPPMEFFADCWGDQPLPRPQLRQFMKGKNGITVEWPRKGTVAREVCYTPYIDTDELNATPVYEKRQFDSVALAWDRQRGLFVKGEKTRHKPSR
ncbi:MAG TPA: hypothetical protein VFA21_07065 [Pyrinomonadaceae bacterium]|jgi:hypothetical protein|nr:hypothetical protein [Pyrinomonadaceae bacterium]